MKETLFSENFRFYNHKREHGSTTDCRSGATMHFLAYMKKGWVRIVSEEKTIVAHAGEAFYIPRGLPYQSYWYTEGEGKVDFLSFGFLDLLTGQPEKYELQTLALPESILCTVSAIPASEGRVDCESLSLFYAAMAQVLPFLARVSSGKDARLVQRIKDYIRAHPHEAMGSVASACAVSEPRLYALFQKHTDTTPNEYRNAVLCEHATALLLTTDKTVEDIADALSFSSAAYLRRVLKKHTGYTPRALRKQGHLLSI